MTRRTPWASDQMPDWSWSASGRNVGDIDSVEPSTKKEADALKVKTEKEEETNTSKEIPKMHPKTDVGIINDSIEKKIESKIIDTATKKNGNKKIEKKELLTDELGNDKQKEREFTLEFTDLAKIKNLSEFLEAFPMQFVPKKEDMGRILSLAKKMHELRSKRGEINDNQPIKIVDIGGANGALGKLITDLAKENNLEIEYTIVDPDTSTVQKSKDFYRDNPALHFEEKKGGDFNIDQYKDYKKITDLMKQRKFLIEAEGKESKEIEELYRISKEIEELVMKKTSKFDLVINSWMPPGMDLTKDVIEAGGAAILYMVERGGATGRRSDAPFPEPPNRYICDYESCNPGQSYESRLGWISHATPQADSMKYSKDGAKSFWKSGGSWTLPFANGFIVQTKKEYFQEGLNLDPSNSDIKINSEYPWEEELTQRGGDISPIIKLSDKNGILDYFKPFSQLADNLEEKEWAKQKLTNHSIDITS